jgi:hypothetical protein
MAVRPSQIRVGAAEAALMIPGVHRLQGEYAKLQTPVAIIAGSDDRLIEPDLRSTLGALDALAEILDGLDSQRRG